MNTNNCAGSTGSGADLPSRPKTTEPGTPVPCLSVSIRATIPGIIVELRNFFTTDEHGWTRILQPFIRVHQCPSVVNLIRLRLRRAVFIPSSAHGRAHAAR